MRQGLGLGQGSNGGFESAIKGNQEITSKVNEFVV